LEYASGQTDSERYQRWLTKPDSRTQDDDGHSAGFKTPPEIASIVDLRSYITLRDENKRSPPTAAHPLQFRPSDMVFPPILRAMRS
jgi:hypothetical protein